MTSDGDYPYHYILVDRIPIAVDLMTWARWFEDIKNRRLFYTVVDEQLDVTVSTIFLGLNHRFEPGEPILFETCSFVPCDRVLHGKLFTRESSIERRYCTYAQAEAGHAEAVAEMQTMVDQIKASTSIISEKSKS